MKQSPYQLFMGVVLLCTVTFLSWQAGSLAAAGVQFIHAENGSDRTYYLTVVRKEPSENPNPPSPDPAPENPSFDTGYNLDSDNMYISGVKAGDNAGTVLGNVRTQNATAYICNRNGDLF